VVKKAYQDVHVLHQERVGVVQLIERDVDLQVLLRERHVLIKLYRQHHSLRVRPTYLERLVEIPNLA
jgi:hypothetical protein